MPTCPHAVSVPLAVPQITGFFSFDIFYYVIMGYTGLVVFHAIITTRDGYCVSLSNQLGARLRTWRRARNSCCGGGCWTPLIWLLERIGKSSARPVPQEYLAPYPMKVRGSWLCVPLYILGRHYIRHDFVADGAWLAPLASVPLLSYAAAAALSSPPLSRSVGTPL